jgi:hypothetical protein
MFVEHVQANCEECWANSNWDDAHEKTMRDKHPELHRQLQAREINGIPSNHQYWVDWKTSLARFNTLCLQITYDDGYLTLCEKHAEEQLIRKFYELRA